MTADAATFVERQGVRVLLVEDNDGDARLVQLMLGGAFGADMDVTRARSLKEALASLDAGPRDCVILDLGLPDASGLEAVQQIKERAPMMPVVVLTGQADTDMGMRAVAAGAQDYLVKGNAVDETLTRAIRYAVVRKHGEDALVRSQQTLAEAQSIAHLGSWELDLTTDVMVWSDELCRLYGHPADPPPGRFDLLERFHPEDAESVRGFLGAAIVARRAFDMDHRILLPDGTTRWLRSQGRVDLDGAGVAFGMRGTAQDITDQRSAEDTLAHQALHDPLTGLPNRTLLIDRLTHALARLARTDTSVGVLFMDIDRFKVVNDSLGHTPGDNMLVALAGRLQATLRASDTLARFGGDEFVILSEDLGGEIEALEIADRIADAMVQPLSWGEGELVVSVSTGIALASSPFISAESLLRDADAAMYRAKADGRARSAVFAENMRARAVDRLDTEVALRHGIEHGELVLHYQPIVELPSRRIVGTEALVRWNRPTRGLVPPEQFIPIAEETGLIVPLGAWVLRQAAGQVRDWQRRPGCESMTMAVNLSALQLASSDLAELVAEVLVESDLAPQCLELEITESVLMGDVRAAVDILEGLKALGVRLSVDDFGTGYSSLSYLKRFPVDTLKIDRSFIAGLSDDPDDTAIVTAILSLASALDLTAVAEGVETSLQANALVELGGRFAQGYYFARPAPAAAIDALLDGQPTAGAKSETLSSRAAANGGSQRRLASPPAPAISMTSVSGNSPGDRFTSEVLDALPDATALLDRSGTIVAVNRAWRMFSVDNGGRPEATGVGVNYLDVCTRAAAGGCNDASEIVSGLQAVLAGHTVESDREYPCPSPTVGRWFMSRITPIGGPTGGAMASHVNISRRKMSELELVQQASHDSLTGLANRMLLTDRLTTALSARGGRSADPDVGVLYIDLDDFKAINDTYGHDAGDEVLLTVAYRLQGQVRPQDTVARLGGDEFVVCAPRVTARDLERLASRIGAALDAPHYVHGQRVHARGSIGAHLAASGDTVASSLQLADGAMYTAKRTGRVPPRNESSAGQLPASRTPSFRHAALDEADTATTKPG